MYLIGFIIWIYHDTRSPQRQIRKVYKNGSEYEAVVVFILFFF